MGPRHARVRFTFDSNILVRAAVSPNGPALRLLDIVLARHSLVLSPFILDELERVLLYPRIQARYQTTAGEAARFAATLSAAAHLVEPAILRPIALLDPADDAVLYTAADGKADILCTRNIRHFVSRRRRRSQRNTTSG
jgi:putative PIN family toxin of toxin-antitoxin system